MRKFIAVLIAALVVTASSASALPEVKRHPREKGRRAGTARPGSRVGRAAKTNRTFADK